MLSECPTTYMPFLHFNVRTILSKEADDKINTPKGSAAAEIPVTFYGLVKTTLLRKSAFCMSVCSSVSVPFKVCQSVKPSKLSFLLSHNRSQLKFMLLLGRHHVKT